MKKPLVLGAGLVAKPLVRYLLEQQDYEVTVATRTVSKAEKLIQGKPNGKAVAWTVEDKETLEELVKDSDIVISLLPYIYHVEVARVCLKYKKPLVTTSYVKPEMQALDQAAKEAGVIFLNELGLDPGIDHMSAMKIIHNIKSRGGKVLSFMSYCGALPAPEAADNPFKYKFAWSPRGVALAGKNSARYRKDGKEINVPGSELFKHHWAIEIESIGELEVYPNRDSVPYGEKYGIPDAETIFRGTLRYPGWCDTWYVISKMGLLSEDPINLEGYTWRKFIAQLVNSSETDVKDRVAQIAGVSVDSEPIKKLEWLGIFEDKPVGLGQTTPLDAFVELLKEKLQYQEGERDMVILKHEIIGAFPDGSREMHRSLLIDYGKVGEETSVARTVALPAAIGTKLILEGKIQLKGVHIPVHPDIYEPILKELETVGITFTESVEKL